MLPKLELRPRPPLQLSPQTLDERHCGLISVIITQRRLGHYTDDWLLFPVLIGLLELPEPLAPPELLEASGFVDELAPKTVKEFRLMVDRFGSFPTLVRVTLCVLLGSRPPWKYRAVSPTIHHAEAL